MGLISTHVEGDELGGGRHRQVINLKPIAYSHQGGLRRITNTLANSGDPSLPIGVDEFVQFRVRDRLAGASPVVHFGRGQSHVRFTPLNTTNVLGQVSGQSITFPGAWQGADLKVTIAGHILHEDILLYAGHPHTFAFRLDDHQGFDPLTLSTPDFRIVNPVLTHPSNPLSVPLVWQTSQQGGKWILSVTLPDGDWAGWTLDPTIVLQPAAADGVDTFMIASAPTTNYGTNAGAYMGADKDVPTWIARELIRFDLSSIPSSATIISASLALYLTDNFATNARNVQVYRQLRDWVEAQATWNVYSTGNNWQTAGGFGAADCEQTSIATLNIPAAPDVNQWFTWVLTPSAVQDWVSRIITNRGLLLKADTQVADAHGYASSDAAANRPKLTVVYTEAAATPIFILRRRR